MSTQSRQAPAAGSAGGRRRRTAAPALSIVLPARNEARAIAPVLEALREHHPRAELLVVDDGSTDATREVAERCGARVVSHPYGMGNGAAVKTGARAARGELLVFMDADGQHDPADVQRLLAHLEEGYDMVVGARGADTQASAGRRWANAFYNHFARWMTGRRVDDLTSGFRAVRAARFREFLYLLPNGFSYPTTITMCFFRMGYPVAYVPIAAGRRSGKSHIRPAQDGVRFLLIIFRVGTLYSPLKVFVPISFVFFATGLGYYVYTYATMHRFTNMSAVMFITAIIIFLIGLVSEQVTSLLYSQMKS